MKREWGREWVHARRGTRNYVGGQVISVLGSPLLGGIERAAQLGQGKGWGAGTVKDECLAISRLLG